MRSDDVFPKIKDFPTDKKNYIKNHTLSGKTVEEWIIEAESHLGEFVSDDPLYCGEPISNDIMYKARLTFEDAIKKYDNP